MCIQAINKDEGNIVGIQSSILIGQLFINQRLTRRAQQSYDVVKLHMTSTIDRLYHGV